MPCLWKDVVNAAFVLCTRISIWRRYDNKLVARRNPQCEERRKKMVKPHSSDIPTTHYFLPEKAARKPRAFAVRH